MAVPKDEQEIEQPIESVDLPKTPSQPSGSSIDQLQGPVSSSTPKQVESDIIIKVPEPQENKPLPVKRKKEMENEKTKEKPPKYDSTGGFSFLVYLFVFFVYLCLLACLLNLMHDLSGSGELATTPLEANLPLFTFFLSRCLSLLDLGSSYV